MTHPTLSPIGFAILGTGMVADYHRAAIEGCADLGAQLVAVSHYEPSQFGEIGARFGVACLTYEELLQRPDVHVVAICTPSGQHADQAVAAALAGKHVLVEKPMALSIADADRMIESCEEADVRLGVTLQYRTTPPFPDVRAAIEQGALGELTLGMVSMPYFRPQAYYDQAAWRGTRGDDGGVLMNQGIHIIDLLCWFMGEPVEVKGFASTLHRDMEAEDTAAVVLRFANNAVATIAATTTTEPGFPHRIEIYGTRGGIQIEGTSVVRWQLAGQSPTVETPAMAASAGSGADPRANPINSHVAIYRDFVDAVRTNRPPLVDGTQARHALVAISALYHSAYS